MKILFCKIASMKYYKGVCDDDPAFNGGEFVKENGFGHEEFNFNPIEFTENDEREINGQKQCVGFVETKSTVNKISNQLHIEKIKGCSLLKNDEFVDNVLVVWCATSNINETTVVGWYKDANVFRYYQPITIDFNDGREEDRYFNVRANADNCILLPQSVRHSFIWGVPSAKKTRSYGFGQSLIWYASEDSAESYVSRLVNNINNYNGENWLYKKPCQ
ncbi:MAG: hypothetical protein AB9835_01745 [Eubacteriales bacterium]